MSLENKEGEENTVGKKERSLAEVTNDLDSQRNLLSRMVSDLKVLEVRDGRNELTPAEKTRMGMLRDIIVPKEELNFDA